ncbi:MAG: GvpL/GvpF family gas vesicle protein [Planctomycetota bacterium]
MSVDSNGCRTQPMVYLVGLARAGTLPGFEEDGLDPTDESRARVITFGAGESAVDAIVIDVPPSMFIGDEAESNLQDVTWIGPRARRHDDIISAARRKAEVMPVVFGSVFSGEQALERTVINHTSLVYEYLDHTEGCDEWSIKAWASRRTAVERAKRHLADEGGGAAAGAAYLLSKRSAAEAEVLAEDLALESVERVIEHLGDSVLDVVERRTSTVDGDPDRWLIAHVAALVHRERISEFDQILDEQGGALESAGLTIELSGPWLPYSFCPVLPVSERSGSTV